MIVAQDILQHLKHLEHERGVLAPGAVVGFRDARPLAINRPLELPQGLPCTVVQASSQLAVRRAMLAHTQEGVMVVVTPLEARQLGEDVVARLAGRKLRSFDPWQAAKTIFKADRVDPMLAPKRALGAALLAHAPSITSAAETTGAITERTAWSGLLQGAFGLPKELHALSAWLCWAILFPNQARRLLLDETELHDELLAYMRAHTGEAFAPLFAKLKAQADQALPGLELVAWGLALRAAADAEQAADDKEGGKLITKFIVQGENALGLGNQDELVDQFVRAACDAHRHMLQAHPSATATVIARLDAIFEAQDPCGIALHSQAARRGWDNRLAALAAAFEHGQPDELQETLASLERHDRARQVPKLMELLSMASRLAYKFHQPAWHLPQGGELAELAREYVDSSSFEDMAREVLATCDKAEAAEAIGRVLDHGAELRAQANERFAQLTAHALGQGALPPGVLPIHRAIGRVVAPLSTEHPVLVLVLDGMSWAVARALLQDPFFETWSSWVPAKDGTHTPILAAVPSVTQLSRTSLLTGHVQQGGGLKEAKEFATNHDFAGKAGAKLFHIKDLDAAGTGAVGDEVARAIGNTKGPRVVAVVINAIDDALSGSTQVPIDWNIGAITPLRSLLELAREHQHVVVLASDHGHIIDHRTERLKAPEAKSARHRPATKEPLRPGELVVAGPGVLKYMGQPQCVVLHDERARYTGRARGYHGGISLPEVVAPLMVLTPQELELTARQRTSLLELQTATPGWWRYNPPESSTPVPKSVQSKHTGADDSPKARAPTGQLDILSDGPQNPTAAAPEPPEHAPDELSWVERLFDSPLYRSMEEKSHVPVGPEDAYRVFVTLEQQNNEASIEQLAHTLTKPPNRMRNTIKGIRLLVNIDGYEALMFNPQEGKVTLDRDLLFKQFGL